jgi:hypothetical protein
MFNKKKSSKSEQPKYTGSENRDIFKTPEVDTTKDEAKPEYKSKDITNGISEDLEDKTRPTGEFEPAIYYDAIPDRYTGHLDYIGAISVSIETSCNYPEMDDKRLSDGVIEKLKPELDKKVKRLFNTSKGDLVVLQEPTLIISDVKSKHRGMYKANVTCSVNGDLYLTTGVNTKFLESGTMHIFKEEQNE